MTRFIREFLYPDPRGIRIAQIQFPRGDETLPATVYRPARGPAHLPGFVMLHGLAYTGRDHPSLVRFARAVAAAGHVVMVPDIPEWRRLHVAPAITLSTIQSAVIALDERGETLHGRTALLGFSFGATQGLVAATAPELRGHLCAVASWGGYQNLHRVFEFGLTGRYEVDDVEHHAEPDPYGRWIMAGNYLTGIPGYEGAGAVAAACLELALETGRVGVYAGDAVYDAKKISLRDALPPDQAALFSLIAPPAAQGVTASPEAVRLSGELADAALRADPLLDPAPFLSRIEVPVLVAHGRDDRLIPYTESVRLARALPPEHLYHSAVTGLFAHSGGSPGLGLVGRARETARFYSLLKAILDLA